MSLLDKTKKVKGLKEENRCLRHLLEVTSHRLSESIEENTKKDKLIAELDAIKQPATLADMTKIMGFLIDYSNVVSRLSAPDPVGVRPEILEIFNRYNIKWTPVKPIGPNQIPVK